MREGAAEAIYARQSVDRADSISIESQIEFCRREAAAGIPRIYTDRGYSGKNTDRPAFRELMADVSGGKIGRVIVYRLDRISRSVLDFAGIIDIFQRHGVDFVSTMEKFDTGAPIGKAMLMIVMIFAQLERETIQQRVLDAYLSRSRRGFYMGGRAPYGFTLRETALDGVKTKMYAPVPEEAETVRRIYRLYADPLVSFGEVAQRLEAQGIEKRGGGSFSRSRIRELVMNPVYVRADRQIYAFFKEQGVLLANPEEDFSGCNGAYLYSGSGSRKGASLQGCTLVLAPHEGLIDSESWLCCRRKCLSGSPLSRPVKASWLAGKIKCGYCGYALALKTYHCKTKADNRYYLCTHKQGPEGCAFRSLDAGFVERAILEEIAGKLDNLRLSEPFRTEPSPQERRLRERQEEIQLEISGLLDKVPLASPALMTHINRRAAFLEEEKQQIEARLSRMVRPSAHPAGNAGYLEDLEALSLCDKRAAADSLLESVHAFSDRITITWKI